MVKINLNKSLNLVIFIAITIFSIGPLLIEKEWLIKSGLIVFLVGTVYLFLKAPHQKLNKKQQFWVFAVFCYAAIFILSFLLRPPYSDDGIWRLSSPGLMLLLLLWFVVVIRYHFEFIALKVLAIGILLWGGIVMAWELIGWHPDLLAPNYKLGSIVSGIAAMGTIIPLGAGLALAIALHEKRSKVWWLLALFGLILVVLLKKRTPLVMYGVMLSVWSLWMLFKYGGLSVFKRLIIILIVAVTLGIGGYVQRDTVKRVYFDYKAAIEHNDYKTSLGLRYKMWKYGIELIKEKPLTGWGPNGYKSEGLWPLLEKKEEDPVVKKLISRYTHLHNQFIMDWVLSGVFAFLFGLFVLIYPAYLSVRYLKDNLGVGVLLSGLVLGVITVMFFGALFTYTYTTTAIMMTLSAIVALASRGET